MRASDRARIKRRKIAEYKIKEGCIDCGYNENPFALEFDHRNNSGAPHTGKQKTVASMMYSSWDTIMNEVEKCDVVCSNCHSIRTFKRRGLIWTTI